MPQNGYKNTLLYIYRVKIDNMNYKNDIYKVCLKQKTTLYTTMVLFNKTTSMYISKNHIKF